MSAPDVVWINNFRNVALDGESIGNMALRYVRADEGDVVIPAAVARAFAAASDTLEWDTALLDILDAIATQQAGVA